MTVLILAGTGDARHIAQFCSDRGIDAIASMAGTTRHPKPLAIETRHGGFGGADGFLDYIRTHTISAVLDMTHPFAARMTQRSFGICREIGIPYLQFDRPGWFEQPGDIWVRVPSEDAITDHLNLSDTVFLATGRQTLHRFSNLSVQHIYCRQIDQPDQPFPFAGGSYIVGRPPFSVEQEEALFSDLGITALVVKNAGGDASRSKLDAARNIGLRVIMLDRPAPSGAPIATTLEQVQAWLLDRS